MTTLTLSAQDCRRLAIAKQRLCQPQPEQAAEAVLDLVRELGCLQLDPIRAVERTQYLVLWSRLGNYDRGVLDQLCFQDRSLFEFWAHCASIVCTEDYALFRPTMAEAYTSNSKWNQRVRAWMAENVSFKQYILDEMSQHGAISPSDLEDRSVTPWQSGGWSNNRNTTQMIQFLWFKGEVVVVERDGLKKKWGMARDFIPDGIESREWSSAEIVHHAAQRSLKALGVATEKQIKKHFIRGRYPKLKQTLATLVAENKIVPIKTEWAGDWFVHTDDLPLLQAIQAKEWRPRTVLLSPFDNLICDRDRTELLWDFYYRIEIYVPKAKRQYGYYVLPVLHNDRFVGRISPRMDYKSGILTIDGTYVEEGVKAGKGMQRSVAKSMRELAKFLGAHEIQVTAEIDQWNLSTLLS